MKIRWLDRRVAHPGPYLALCLSSEEFHAAMKHLKADDQGAKWIVSGNATTHLLNDPRDGQPCAVVCVSDWQGRDPIEVAGLIVHEAVHVWQFYAQSIGEGRPGDEQEAYAVQGISQSLMAEFARRMG